MTTTRRVNVTFTALIRDSVNPDGPRLALTGSQFRSLLTAIKDLP